VAVSFIGGWGGPEHLEKTTDLSQVADKLYHMLYTSPWSRFELTTSVVIGTDCIVSFKPNYHTITATTGLLLLLFSYYFHLLIRPARIWSYGRWIYNYQYNQCLSPLQLWIRTPLRRGELDTTLFDKVCQWLATGRWFSPGPPVSSTNKTDCHDITEILLKVALSAINQPIWECVIDCREFLLLFSFIKFARLFRCMYLL